jgi:hypothetical protein
MDQTTESRLTKLERTNRRLTIALAVMASLLVVVVSIGAVQGPAQVIEGQTLVLSNPDKTARIIMSAEPDGATTLTFNRQGKVNTTPLGLGVTKDGVSIVNLQNGGSVMMGVSQDGTPALRLDAGGSAITVVPRKDPAALEILDADKNLIFSTRPR